MKYDIEEYEMNRIVFSAVIGFLCRRFGIQQSKEYLEEIVIIGNRPMLKVRKKLRLTQAEFAWLIGVHEITVSKWERKILDPTPHQKMMISFFEKSQVEDLDVPKILKSEGPVFTTVKILATIKEISDNL